MSAEQKQISVVIARDGDGHVKRAYASKEASVIIDISNTLRAAGYDPTTLNCELVTKAPRVRRLRTK